MLLATLSACTTSFQEDHFYEVTQESGSTPLNKNYFRIRIKGRAQLSSARYVSGYYDERAVDLFFNELKVSDGTTVDKRPLFPADLVSPGTSTKVTPLEPGQYGAFVMVFSTNASAVTNAIGQFAQNQVVADAITNLVNQDTVRRLRGADPQPQFEQAQAKAVARELDALMALVPEYSPGPPPKVGDKEATKRACLRILNLIARAGGAKVAFGEFEDAVKYFRARGGGR
jgi:hypothetical protein